MIQRIVMRLVRFGFRLLYYELAWTYDGVSWLVSLGEWRRWQQAALPYVVGERVLEIGHGPGHMLLDLATAVPQVFGLDLSPSMGRLAQKKLQKAGQPVSLVQARVQTLPWATAVFDTVLSTFPTEYILDPQTIHAVYRVLRPNGRFLIVPEGHLVGRGVLQRGIDWLFRVTGQRDDAFRVDESGFWTNTAVWQPFQQALTTAAFSVEIKQIKLKRSVVTLIIAQK